MALKAVKVEEDPVDSCSYEVPAQKRKHPAQQHPHSGSLPAGPLAAKQSVAPEARGDAYREKREIEGIRKDGTVRAHPELEECPSLDQGTEDVPPSRASSATEERRGSGLCAPEDGSDLVEIGNQSFRWTPPGALSLAREKEGAPHRGASPEELKSAPREAGRAGQSLRERLPSYPAPAKASAGRI
jgi:hypothetical protein